MTDIHAWHNVFCFLDGCLKGIDIKDLRMFTDQPVSAPIFINPSPFIFAHGNRLQKEFLGKQCMRWSASFRKACTAVIGI